ncbi:hypothetical protein PENSPDRAFT_607027 [Peniophora sp. CONT]|nr:hypothetical protein PENSPDRAFT_607027 [Peniophora sp. CONT]
MLVIATSLLLGLALVAPAAAQSSFTPAIIPIAARSPYLLNYLSTTPSVNYSQAWPVGYSNQVQAWSGLIRVDGETYIWAGDIKRVPSGIVNPLAKGFEQTLTPTRSMFVFQAGVMSLTVTFLSPIEASTSHFGIALPILTNRTQLGNLTKQSIPASYLALDVSATDGRSHSVQVYTDITAEWVAGDRSQDVTWFTNTSNPAIIYHSVSAVNQVPYHETNAQADWGNVYYAALNTSNTTFRAAAASATRGQFVQNGTLDNTEDMTSRRPVDINFPVFAFSQDLGSIQQTSKTLVWAVANVRDSDSNSAIRYTDLSRQPQNRSLYYRNIYTEDSVLLSDFLADFPAALDRSRALDNNITQAARSAGGPQYPDILALATRQAYCGIEITVGRNVDGSVNASDVMAFYKDIGTLDNGDGNAQVSPVDGLLSIFPAFLYLDPALCGFLLEPLLRFQDSNSYTNQYAALNLGTQYPLADANSNTHTERIETSSGMIIMAYGHANATGDHGIIGRYFTLLMKWADFLTSNTLNATNETSADVTIPVSGQTNLALKGIIAVQAMSRICSLLDDSTNEEKYSSRAKSLYSQWSAQALTSDGHLRFSYNETNSFSLGYNMFWDLVLGTGLLNGSVFTAQTSFIASKIQNYGAPTDNTNMSVVSANWNMLAAAIATRDTDVQRAFINATHSLPATALQRNMPNSGQFPLMYTAQNGAVIGGRSSPRQGAAYAPLLVSAESFPGGSTLSNEPTRGKNNRTGTIVGTTLGAVAVIFLLAGLVFFVRRRRLSTARKAHAERQQAILGDTSSSVPSPVPLLGVTPFLGVDSNMPLPGTTEDSSSAEERTAQDAGTKRAYRLRRVLHEELQQRATSAHGPSATTTPQASAPLSDQGDPSSGQGLRHEISNIWREISALRMNDGMAPPPEYNA